MNACEEAEIKIEYSESFDVDPLLENNERHFSNTNVQIYNNFESNNHFLSEKQNDIENEKWYQSIDNIGRYICRFCPSSYSTVQTLRQHIQIKHSNQYKSVKNIITNSLRKSKPKCHVCKRRFKMISELQEHVQKIHDIENLRTSCSICHASFKNNIEMLSHMQNEHNCSKLPKYFCNVCAYSTSKLSHYKQHNNTHVVNNKKKCSYCEYSTNYLPNLKTHERIHTNVKLYACTVAGCGYSGVAKSALYSHSLRHSDNVLFCDKCGYRTVYKQCLRKHIDSHDRKSVRLKL